jgi:hypothetical protein
MGQDENQIHYRVVYRTGTHLRSLGRLRGVPASRQTLDPFHSRLVLAGICEGDLLLVEERTRRIAVHRVVRLPLSRR